MYASNVIKVAEDQIGYIEKASDANLDSKTANAGSNNHTKYGRDLHKAGYYNGDKCGYPWCDQFVDWCFYIAANKSKTLAEKIQCQTGPYGAGCGYSMQYYQDAGRFDKKPKLGDQIFFRYKGTTSGADHTGLVVDLTDTVVVTVEGNSGDRVQMRNYSRNDPTIYGYGHPRYDTEPVKATIGKDDSLNNIGMKTLRIGDADKGNNGDVHTLQRILRQLGYVGIDGKLIEVDGEFGKNTEFAVKKFQKNRGSSLQDGIVGIWTWTKLLKG